ncbi:MAG: TonB-dependent receptor plug domain-containing protein [Pirellulales bacterium]
MIAVSFPATAWAQDDYGPKSPDQPPPAAAGLGGGLTADMKLEDLVRQDVVVPALSQVVETVDRQVSTVGRTPAAVFVITPEMIKRSGARYIPEVLRMAPGISVAKIDSSTWAITARGFQGRFANKLLVQIDGRVVYSPVMFGGVYWDVQDLPLQDVERIEVIRGPGTTAWGSNAVNGVINILTKKSSDTQGALIQSGGGNQEQDFNTVRYGGQSGDLSWRAYGKQFDRNKGWSPRDIQDQWRQQRGGFRADWTPSDEDTVTLQGDIYNGYEGLQFTNTIRFPPGRARIDDEEHVSGGDILFRFDRVLDEDTSWQFLAYYDKMRRNMSAFAFTQDTYNLDIQYQFSPHEFHQFITGANYRRVQDFTTGGFSFSLTPPSFATQWASVFAQDTMTLVDDYLYFTLGVRLEYNTFGKFQPEPTARLLILPSQRESAWIAVSRAARMPTRFETGVNERIFAGGISFFDVVGNPNQIAEDLVAYEIGYRAAPTDYFSWDIAAYINDYHNLQGFGNPGTPFLLLPPPNVVILIPVPFANNTRALSYGAELTATYQLTESWQLNGSYSVFEVTAQTSEIFDITVPIIEGGTPHNQVYLRSSWDLSDNWQFDLIGRYVDRVTALEIPKYIEMDAVLSWQATPTMEFSLVGQNLLNPHHLEYVDWQLGMEETEVVRGVYGMFSWTY